MKKYFTIYLFTTFLCIGGLVLVNYTIDPAHIFSDNFEKGVAKAIVKQQNVAEVGDLDERMLQKYLVASAKKKDVVVIGSSRSMLIRDFNFPGRTFYNSSVSGAVLEDYLSIYRLYEKNGKIPKVLVLGFDPWLLNANNTTGRWKSLKKELEEMVGILDSKVSVEEAFIPEKIKTLVSLPYLIKSLQHMRKCKKNIVIQSKVKTFTGEHCDTGGIRQDGSRAYNKATREKSIEAINLNAVEFTEQRPVYALGRFDELSQERSDILEKFIDHLQLKQVKVIIYLPPYHPLAYSRLLKNPLYRILTDVEHSFRELAGKKNIQVVGSYDPSKVDCHNSDFIDALHPSRSGIDKIFNLSELKRF